MHDKYWWSDKASLSKNFMIWLPKKKLQVHKEWHNNIKHGNKTLKEFYSIPEIQKISLRKNVGKSPFPHLTNFWQGNIPNEAERVTQMVFVSSVDMDLMRVCWIVTIYHPVLDSCELHIWFRSSVLCSYQSFSYRSWTFLVIF